MEHILFQASIYLLAAVVAVPLASRLGLGSVLGYLAAGILIGPAFGIVGTETKELQHIAEFGVVMMLFLIGLELEPRALWDMRHKLIGLGGLQIGLTAALVTIAVILLGYDWRIGFAIGLILSLSSTAIVLQTLSEKGLMQTQGGRSTFSVLLTQDIAVIPMLAFMPLLAMQGVLSFGADGSIQRAAASADEAHGMSLVQGLPAWGVTLVTIGVVAAIILAGIYLTRPIFQFIHAARLREMYTALALLIVMGISFVMYLVGLSPALGTFLAGVVLANSEFRHELESDIEPFKGLLLGLFFITVGAGINFDVLFAAPATIMSMTLGVIAIKGAVLYGLARAFKLHGRHKWLFTMGLAQAGEFGFVLTSFAVGQNVLPTDISEQILLVIALSMLITPLLFILYELVGKNIIEHHGDDEDDEINEQGPVIIAGVGRFGQVVNRLVRSSGFETIVLDNDLQAIQLVRKFGMKGFLGDPTRPEMLRAAGLSEASVLVVAIDDPENSLRLVNFARRERPDIHIIARARDRNHVFRLYQAGANDIVRELFDSSLRAGRYVLENMGLTEFEAAEAEKAFYFHDRHALQELAQLWDPNLPVDKNQAYIDRANELEAELKTSLLSAIEAKRGG